MGRDPSRGPIEPWSSLLRDLDDELSEQTTLYCMGGFAVVQAYGLERVTADIDVLFSFPHVTASRLQEPEGYESRLRSLPLVLETPLPGGVKDG